MAVELTVEVSLGSMHKEGPWSFCQTPPPRRRQLLGKTPQLFNAIKLPPEKLAHDSSLGS